MVEPFLTRYLQENEVQGGKAYGAGVYLLSQCGCEGPEFRRYSMQDGSFQASPAMYLKHLFDATLNACAQSHTVRGTPPRHALLGGILSQPRISW